MASVLAWLDASAEEQRRMREIIRLFSDKDSRDELGLGQVRDAISDALFPGTTVLLTRARYLLFVPWCFQLAEGATDPLAKAEQHERELIATLLRSGADDLAGLLGARAGTALQTLPSTVYWTALRRWSIVGEAYAWRADVFSPIPHEIAGDDERQRRGPSAWSATLPPRPDGFPSRLDDAFALTHHEAAWLRERVLDAVPGTVLAHLMDHRPDPDSRAPWRDGAVARVAGSAAELVRHAAAFSTVMHGASLLYNLLLAEEFERAVAAERAESERWVARYREHLDTWAGPETASHLRAWDLDEFWRWVARGDRVIAPATVQFISAWTGLVRSADLGELATNREARDLIRARERRQKGAQARLGSPKRLSTWSGASAASAMVYRWPVVRRIVHDIHDGLQRDA